MMKKYFLAAVLLFSTFLTFAQKKSVKKNISIAVHYDSQNKLLSHRISAMKFQNYLRTWAKRNYNYGHPGLISLTSSIEVNNEKTIEGMETMVLADVTIKVELLNTVTGEEKTWETVVKGKGTDVPSLKKKAIRKFDDSADSEEMYKYLDRYLEDEFIKNCQKYFDIAIKKYDERDYIKTLQILSCITKATSCSKMAKDLMKEAYLMEQKKVCNDYVYKATLAYESGDYEKAVENLYKISPSSQCAKESMALAKKIGQKFKKADEISKKTISVHKFIIEHNSPEKWAEWDEKIMLDLISQ